jgi:hypothetical protein
MLRLRPSGHHGRGPAQRVRRWARRTARAERSQRLQRLHHRPSFQTVPWYADHSRRTRRSWCGTSCPTYRLRLGRALAQSVQQVRIYRAISPIRTNCRLTSGWVAARGAPLQATPTSLGATRLHTWTSVWSPEAVVGLQSMRYGTPPHNVRISDHGLSQGEIQNDMRRSITP